MFKKEIVKEGDVLGWKPNDFVGRAISFFTGKYCHVGYYRKEDTTIEAHLNLDGVKSVYIDPEDYKLIDVFRLKENIDCDIKSLSKSFDKTVGLNYDAPSFVSKFIRAVLMFRSKDKPLWNSLEYRDCAENVALCFKENGVDLTLNIHPQSVTPTQVCLSKKLKRVC